MQESTIIIILLILFIGYIFIMKMMMIMIINLLSLDKKNMFPFTNPYLVLGIEVGLVDTIDEIFTIDGKDHLEKEEVEEC